MKKLLKSYVNSNESITLLNELTKLNSEKKLRKYLFSEISSDNVQIIFQGLHNRAFNIKTNDSFSPILNDGTDDSPSFSEKTVNNEQIVNNKNEDETNYELEFTSDFSELTQYDVNSIMDTTEQDIHKQFQTESPDKLSGNKLSRQLESTPKNNSQFSVACTPDSARSRYEEISRRKSPTRENISKLNLFRNIFSNDSSFINNANNSISQANNSDYNQSCLEIADTSSNSSSHFQYSAAKFYKINELVSIMAPPSYVPPIHDDKIGKQKIVKTVNSRSQAKNTIPSPKKELINDIQLAKSEFIKRKQDYLENNIKTNMKNIEKKALPEQIKQIKKPKKEKIFRSAGKILFLLLLSEPSCSFLLKIFFIDC